MSDIESKFSNVKITSLEANIKYQNRKDLVIVQIPQTSTTVGVFTKNAFAAAPVLLCKKHLAEKPIGALVINSGNANAATGELGLKNAQRTCELVADLLNIDATQVLPFSTGVIGEHLPMEKIEQVFAKLSASAIAFLGKSSFQDFAETIMTTDTFAKLVQHKIEIGGQEVNFIGVAKGAGMIMPNMATTLCFVFTDAKIEKNHLQTYLKKSIEPSFNSISIDGDTSTNDSCTLTALGTGAEIGADNAHFEAGLTQILTDLALLLVKDGEGATKLIHIKVEGAKDIAEAKEVGLSIANSPLVKTAFFASDPNWGRLVMAIGKSKSMEDLDISKVNLYLEDFALVEQGGKASTYDEATAAKIMQSKEINIRVQLGRGTANTIIHTSDFSYDYVKINAEYRS